MIPNFFKVTLLSHKKFIIPFFLFLFSLLFYCKNKDADLPKIDFESSPDTLELLFPGQISTQLTQRDFALSPDRNEVIYTLGNQKESIRFLVSLKKENGRWGNKTILNFCGKYQDIEPFFSKDGKQLFFASNRPIYGDSTRTDYNIWVTTKDDKGLWHKPTPLDSTINTKGQEFYPCVTNSGNLYFTATRPEGHGLEDIYVSEFKNQMFQNPKVLDSTINSKSYEFNAYINPEESLIIFSSYGRPDGYGGGDLYFSSKDSNGNWKPAKNLGETINSNKLDFCPFYDSKTKTLYFSSLRTHYPDSIESIQELIKLAEHPKNGFSSIYRIHLDRLIQENTPH